MTFQDVSLQCARAIDPTKAIEHSLARGTFKLARFDSNSEQVTVLFTVRGIFCNLCPYIKLTVKPRPRCATCVHKT